MNRIMMNKVFRLALLSFAGMMLLYCGAFGQSGYYLFYAAPELLSARATALGPGFVAFADDAGCGFLNPAGLGFIEGYQLIPMVSGDFNGARNVMTLGGLKYIEGLGTFAISFQSGAQEAFDKEIIKLTTSAITKDKQVIFSVARALNSHFSAGLNYKYYFAATPDGDFSMGDVTIGMLYRSNDFLRVGASIDNFIRTKSILESETIDLGTGSIITNETEIHLTRVFRGAAALTTRNSNEPTTLVLGAAVPHPVNVEIFRAQWYGNIGVEQWFRYNLPLSWGIRASYTGRNNIGAVGVGASLKISREYDHWRFDYAYQDLTINDDYLKTLNGGYELGGIRHSISVVYEFGGTGYNMNYAKNIDHPSEQELSQEYAALVPYARGAILPQTAEGDYYITVPPAQKQWKELSLHERVEDLSSSWRKQIVFILDPQNVGRVARWKLFISSKGPTSPISFSVMEERAVQVLEGKGAIPNVINWYGKDKYDEASKGYYYYFLVVWDVNGDVWRSHWRRFEVK